LYSINSIFETTEWILMNFGIACMHQKLLSKLDFGLYGLNINLQFRKMKSNHNIKRKKKLSIR